VNYCNASQLTQENSTSDGVYNNQYDANGSLTNRASASESAAYVYDLQNRLAGATVNRVESGHTVAITASYTNNYAGLRVRSVASESVDGGGATVQTRLFLRDAKGGNAQVLEELPAIGNVPTVSYTIGSKVLSQSKSGVVSHLLSDGHGSTRLLTGSTGAITDRYSYDAYGKTLGYDPGMVNQPATAMLYSGEFLDRDLQQYYLEARYYNPAVGRFGAIDPFSPNQLSGANLYVYCGNDPVNGADPSGLYDVDVHRFLTQFLAREAGFTADAEFIGRQTQALDDPRSTRSANVKDTFLPDWPNMGKYHFVDQAQLQTLRDTADFNNLQKNKGESIGNYLHALEDTFSHSPGEMGIKDGYFGDVKVCGATILGHGGAVGHLSQGHDPDHTWKHPAKAMNMAKTIFAELKDNAPAGNPSKDWSDIEKKVNDFVYNRPNFYFEYGFIRNVTFDGYNAKIKCLDTSYELDRNSTLDYSKVYKDVTGYKDGTQFHPPGMQVKCAQLLMMNPLPQ